MFDGYVSVLFGYGNGIFGNKLKLMLNIGYSSNPVVISDFNSDSHLDIAAFTYSPYSINIFFGDGHGNFIMNRIFSSESGSENDGILADDFNGDGYRDLISFSQSFLYLFLNTRQCNTNVSICSN